MKTTILLLLSLILSTQAKAYLVSDYDSKNQCRVYKVLKSEELEKHGDYEILSNRAHYGLRSSELQIDFNNNKAIFEITLQVVMGIDRNLIGEGQKVFIRSQHPQFNETINTINRRVLNFQTVCLNDGEIVYLE